MPRDFDEDEELDSETIRRLAKAVAEAIVKGELVDPHLEELVGRRVCPPNKLCCWAGYTCAPPFYCDEYFGCINRFSGASRGGAAPSSAEPGGAGGSSGKCRREE